MSKKIFLLGLCLLSLLCLLCISSITEKFTYNISDLGSSLFFSPSLTKRIIRPVNTPLIPLISPQLYITDIIIKMPNILVYKPKFLSPIVDQGVCGSCWAFIVSDLLTNLTKILTNGYFNSILSAQQLLNCYKPEQACYGQSPEDVFIWMIKHNIKLTTTKKIPYLQQISKKVLPDQCPNITSGINVKKGSIKSICQYIPEFNFDRKILNKNIYNMKKTLFNIGPFFASMSIYNDFFTYNGSEIYKPSKNTYKIGGHAILIIGYCEKNVDTRIGFTDGYWVCKNTWGYKWGVNGYFGIQIGNNICGIESRCGIIYPNININKKLNLSLMRINNINDFKNLT